MKFSCMMELNKYPLDVQVCTMEVASCKYIKYLCLLSIHEQISLDMKKYFYE